MSNTTNAEKKVLRDSTEPIDVVYVDEGKKKKTVSKLEKNQDDIRQVVRSNVRWFKQKQVKDDNELLLRIEYFFEDCANKGELPTFEKMCLVLGAPIYVVKSWQTSSQTTQFRKDVLAKAVTFLAAVDAELVVNGTLPAIPYIFRAKNYYEMTDSQDVTFHASDPLGEAKDTKELQKKYIESTAVDDPISVDFTET